MTTIALQCDLRNQRTRCFWRQQSSCSECVMYKGRSRRPHNGREVALCCPLCCPLPLPLPGLLQVELFLQTQSRLFQILTGSNSRGELGSRSPTFLSWRKKPTNGSYTLPVADRPQGLTLYKVDSFTFFSALPVKWGLGNMIIRGKLSHFNPPVWCLCQAHQGDFVSRYPGRFLTFLFPDAVFELFLPGRLCIGSFLLRSRYKQLNKPGGRRSQEVVFAKQQCNLQKMHYHSPQIYICLFVCLFIGRRMIRDLTDLGPRFLADINWPNLQPLKVASYCGQTYNLCKKHHLVAKF